MKKIYLSFLALAVAGVANAQRVSNTVPFRTENHDVKTATKAPQDKGAQLWFDDFSNSANWYMTTVGADPKNWTIGQSATGNGGFPLADIQSSSGTPFALFDADDASGTPSFDASITTVNPINCSGNANVSLVFESYFRPFNTTAIYVEVSTDSVNFTSSYPVHTNVAVNGATANPELTTVNISAAAGNQPKVWIRFRYTGSWDYGWAIDDVAIEVTENNDLFASEGYYGTAGVPYTRVPVRQIQPVDFFMRVDNVGAVDQPNTIMTATVNASPVATSLPQTVMAGAVADSLGMAGSWTPPATVGVPYDIAVIASSDSVESTPANNGIAFMPLEVSADLYAHDDFGGTGPFWNNGGGYNTQVTPPTEEFEAGNWFDIFVTDTATSIDVVIGTNSQAGAIIDAAIYDISSGSFVEVPGSRTAPYSITAGDASSNATITLPFSSPIELVTGTYFVCVHAWAGAGAEFFYATSGSSLDGQGFGAQQSLIFYPTMAAPNSGENFYTTQTPTVRLRTTAMTTSIENVVAEELNFNVYPNPSATGEFTINLNAATSENVNLTVTNVVGQTVVNRVIAVSGQTKEVISLAGQSKGVYFLTVNNETVKLIIK